MDENRLEELADRAMAGMQLSEEDVNVLLEHNRQVVNDKDIMEQCDMLCNSLAIALSVGEGFTPNSEPPFVMTKSETLDMMVGTAQAFINLVTDNPLFAAEIITSFYCMRLQERGMLIKGFMNDDYDTPESFDR